MSPLLTSAIFSSTGMITCPTAQTPTFPVTSRSNRCVKMAPKIALQLSTLNEFHFVHYDPILCCFKKQCHDNNSIKCLQWSANHLNTSLLRVLKVNKCNFPGPIHFTDISRTSYQIANVFLNYLFQVLGFPHFQASGHPASLDLAHPDFSRFISRMQPRKVQQHKKHQHLVNAKNRTRSSRSKFNCPVLGNIQVNNVGLNSIFHSRNTSLQACDRVIHHTKWQRFLVFLTLVCTVMHTISETVVHRVVKRLIF